MTRGAYDSGVLLNGSIGPVLYRKETKGKFSRWHRVPECGHPDRKHASKGMCTSCYNSAKYLVKDHSHNTGQSRDKICSYCNLMLGHAFDNPWILRKGAEYLERHHGVSSEGQLVSEVR
jgi:hypothetical protein